LAPKATVKLAADQLAFVHPAPLGGALDAAADMRAQIRMAGCVRQRI